jgi:hypothetical protein
MSAYYDENSLRPNPSKTQVCDFQLRTTEAKRKLHVSWTGSTLEHTDRPKYLGITLDRSLTGMSNFVHGLWPTLREENVISKFVHGQQV